MHDQILNALASTSDRRLRAQGDSDCGENSTLATAVVANEEVQARCELNSQVLVTHEVHKIDTLENSGFRNSL